MDGVSPTDAVAVTMATGLLFDIAKDCVVGALIEWKKQKEATAEKAATELLAKAETAKGLQGQVADRITEAVREFPFRTEDKGILLRLEQDPVLKGEVVHQIVSFEFSATVVAKAISDAAPEFADHQERIHQIAEKLLTAIKTAISGNEALCRVLGLELQIATLKGVSEVRSEIKAQAEQTHRIADLTESMPASFEKLLEEKLKPISAQLSGISSATAGLSAVAELTATTTIRTEHQARFDRVRKEMFDGSLRRAEQEYRDLIHDLEAAGALADKHLLGRACNNLGVCLSERRKEDEASSWYEKAHKYAPSEPKALANMAGVLLSRSDPEAARKLIDEGLRLHPDDPAIIRQMVMFQLARNDQSGALAFLEAHRTETVAYYVTMAGVQKQLENFSAVVDAAQKAISIDPKCEEAKVALCDGYGIPILLAKQASRTPSFGLSEDERSRLDLAIQWGGAAVVELREKERYVELARVLTNLSAFYAARGQAAKALDAAKEACDHFSDDVVALGNLFVAQMQSHLFDVAFETACRLETFKDYRSVTTLKLEALVAGRRPKDALALCEKALASASDLAVNPRFIVLYAEALFADLNRDKAIDVVSEGVRVLPHDATLYARRAAFHERAGRIEIATVDFAKAESLVTEANRAGVLLSTGLFYYHQARWSEAASRFEASAGNTTDSPVLTEYLVSLYNAHRYSDCLSLVERAIKIHGFDPVRYELAGRCYSLLGELLKGEKILEELALRHTQSNAHIEKLLAEVHYRLDKVDRAYTVLDLAAARYPKDADLLINLSGLALLQKKYYESVDRGHQAVKLAPKNQMAHWALVRAVLACPRNVKPGKKQIGAFRRSMKLLATRFPNSGLQMINVDKGLENLQRMLKEQSDHASLVENLVREKNLPLAFLVKASGRSPYAIWKKLCVHPILHVRMSSGNFDEQATEQRIVRSAKAVSVDIFALFTLQLLGKLHLLPQLFETVYINTRTLEVVAGEIHDQEIHSQGHMIVGHQGDQLVRTEVTASQIANEIKWLSQVRDFLKSNDVHLRGVDPAVLEDNPRKQAIEAIGEVFYLPVALAGSTGAAFYSDDVRMRALAKHEHKVDGFCTQALLRVAAERKLISPQEYEDALLTLIRWNYAFVSDGSGTLIRSLEVDNYTLSPLVQRLFRRILEPEINQETCALILGQVVGHLWRSIPSKPGTSKEDLLRFCIDAIIHTNRAADLFEHLIAGMGIYVLTTPDVFVGSLLWIMNNGMLSDDQRSIFFRKALRIMPLFTDASERLYPTWRTLTITWQQKHETLVDLWQIGLLRAKPSG